MVTVCTMQKIVTLPCFSKGQHALPEFCMYQLSEYNFTRSSGGPFNELLRFVHEKQQLRNGNEFYKKLNQPQLLLMNFT